MVAIIIMGSPSDAEFCEEITDALESFGIPWQTRVASAHKTPERVRKMLEKYESDPQAKVYITVAGRSNALSGFVDAQVIAPVIACPPYSSTFAGADIYSSLRMPSGVAPAVVLEPKNAALLAAKALSLAEPALQECIRAAHAAQRQRLYDADAEINAQ